MFWKSDLHAWLFTDLLTFLITAVRLKLFDSLPLFLDIFRISFFLVIWPIRSLRFTATQSKGKKKRMNTHYLSCVHESITCIWTSTFLMGGNQMPLKNMSIMYSELYTHYTTRHRCTGISRPLILPHIQLSKTRRISLAPLQFSPVPHLAWPQQPGESVFLILSL